MPFKPVMFVIHCTFFFCRVGSDVLETELNAAQHERCDAELESANCDSLTRPWLLRRQCVLRSRANTHEGSPSLLGLPLPGIWLEFLLD